MRDTEAVIIRGSSEDFSNHLSDLRNIAALTLRAVEGTGGGGLSWPDVRAVLHGLMTIQQHADTLEAMLGVAPERRVRDV